MKLQFTFDKNGCIQYKIIKTVESFTTFRYRLKCPIQQRLLRSFISYNKMV